MNKNIDFDNLIKIAEGEQQSSQSVPTIGRFLVDFVRANSAPFEQDEQTASIARIVTQVLANYFAVSVDIKQPAFHAEFNQQYKQALNPLLVDIDFAQVVPEVRSRIALLGDEQLSAAADQLSERTISSLADFALMRGYIDSYRQYVMRNPLSQIILENKGQDYSKEESFDAPLSTKEAARKKKKEEGSPSETPQAKGRGTGKFPKTKSITEHEGDKLRLSQLVDAYRILRSQEARKCMKAAGDIDQYSSYIALDAQTDHLILAAEQIKKFVQQNSLHKYFRWNGESLGSEDPFVLNLGNPADSVNKLFPVPFSQTDVKLKYLNIKGEEREITSLDPSAVEMYRWHVQDHFSDVESSAKYNEKFKKDLVSDANVHREWKYKSALSTDKSKSRLDKKQLDLLSLAGGHDYFKVNPNELILKSNIIFQKANEASRAILAMTDLTKIHFEVSQIHKKFVKQILENSPFKGRADAPAALDKLIRSLLEGFGVPYENADLVGIFAGKTIANIFRRGSDIVNHLEGLPEQSVQTIKDGIKSKIVAFVKQVDGSQNPPYDGSKPREFKKYAGLNGVALQNDINMAYCQLLPKDSEGDVDKSYSEALNETMSQCLLELYPDIFSYFRFHNEIRNIRGTKTVKELRNVFVSPYFELPKLQEEFKKEQEEYSEDKLHDFIVDPIIEGLKIIEANPEPLGLPGKPTSVQMQAILPHLQKRVGTLELNEKSSPRKRLYILNTENIAWAALMKDYLLKFRIPMDQLTELAKQGKEQDYLVRELLDAAYPNEPNQIDTRAFYVYVARLMNEKLEDLIADKISERFQSVRGEGGSSFVLSNLAANAVQADKLGKIRTIEEEAAEEEEEDARLKKWIESDEKRMEILSEFSEATSYIPNQSSYQEFADEESGDSEFSDEDGAKKAKKELAMIEAHAYLKDYASSPEQLFRVVPTRATNHEQEGDPRRLYDLSSVTIGGSLKQAMGYSRSHWIDEKFFNEDPLRFFDYWMLSNAKGMGGYINRLINKDVSEHMQKENISVGQLMEKVGAFAMPLWGISRYSEAFQNHEMAKVLSGITPDENDTAEKAYNRALYFCHPVKDPAFENKMRAYFDDKAERFLGALKIISKEFKRKEAEEYLILRYKHDPSVSVAQNPRNDPFSKWTPEVLGEYLNRSGITVESLEAYFFHIKRQNEMFEKGTGQGLGIADYSTPEKAASTLLDKQRTLDSYNGSMVAGPGSIHTMLMSTPVPDESRGLLVKAAKFTIEEINKKINNNSGVYQELISNTIVSVKTVREIMKSWPADFEELKPAIEIVLDAAVSGNYSAAKRAGVRPDTPFITRAFIEANLKADEQFKKDVKNKSNKPEKPVDEELKEKEPEEAAKEFVEEVAPEKAEETVPETTPAPVALAPLSPTAPASTKAPETPKELAALVSQLLVDKVSPLFAGMDPKVKARVDKFLPQYPGAFAFVEPKIYKNPEAKKGLMDIVEKLKAMDSRTLVDKAFTTPGFTAFYAQVSKATMPPAQKPPPKQAQQYYKL